jgi:ABC-type antimicrobial peptide transport system permease subunit
MVSNPLTDPEWADRSVDFIDRVVSTIRRYTTQPLVSTARGIVFGLLGSFGVVAIVVLTVVGLTRGLQAGLDALVTHEAAVWISYFILAAVFGLLGAILMRRRYTEEDK